MVALRSVLEFPQPSRPAAGGGELETRLQHFQKTEALGRAALGVAHEFNNLLGVVGGYTDLLQANQSLDDQAQEALGAIRQATDRASELTQQLLSFGRRRPTAGTVADLAGVVASMRQIIRCVLGSSIRLVVMPGPEPCRVRVSAGQVEQVLLNLVVNARDALQGATALTPAAAPGGQVMVATGPVHLEQDYRHAHGVVPAGAYGRLVVSDTGCGMDATTQARLFEPFYTTKEPGKGTGLGMAIVAALLQQSDGHITLWSERGRGTRFEVYWPLLGNPTG
jgi:signal transduction histidine kinase